MFTNCVRPAPTPPLPCCGQAGPLGCQGVPVLVDRDANASMGSAIDQVKEYIPGFEGAHAVGAPPLVAG